MSIYDIEIETLAGETGSMKDYEGKVLLIVNTASKCGFTPQYAGLEALYQELHPRGLEILGFPCNQFGAQEPGTHEEIGGFCQKNYGVSFPMHAKVDVNGDEAHPLFGLLQSSAKGVLGTKKIKWNFTKFLVDRDGKVVRRYGSTKKPSALKSDIEALL